MAARPVAPSAFGVQSMRTTGPRRRTPTRPSHRASCCRLASFGGHFRGGDQREEVHLHARPAESRSASGSPAPAGPGTTRCSGPASARSPGILQGQLHRLGLLALLLDQQAIVLAAAPMMRAGRPSSVAPVMAASASRNEISFQPSAKTSIFRRAFTRTTSFSTVASLVDLGNQAPTGGFCSAAGRVFSRAACHNS